MTRMKTILVAAVAGLLIGSAAHAVGQSAQPAGAELPQILQEIRGLRADLRETASVTSRTQVLLARIQLQEQRILHLDQERSAVSGKRMELERVIASQTDAQKRFEAVLGANSAPREERDAIAQMTEQNRAQLAQFNQQRGQLVTQENEYASAIDSEQSRWNQFNAQLDELERSLAR